MSSSYTLATPLEPYHIRNLILILRRANDHYTHVAARIRASLRPTRHAHRRAQYLGLTIDVQSAHNCPQKQVSVVPLPILEVSPAPAALAHDIREQAREPLKRRPALKCAIPRSTILTRTSPNGTTSALSSGSHYSSVTLSSAAPSEQPSVVHQSSRWFTTVDERYPRNATDAGASAVRATQLAQEWGLLDVPIDENAMDWGLELRCPEDVCAMDVSPSTSASSTASSSVSVSNSDSTASSAGPATPPSNEVSSPLMIRIKRKSTEFHNNDSFEKRPRVFNDEAHPQRRNVIRIPARR